MAEFLTMEEAKDHFGSKGKTNAGLTLGIIGTAPGESIFEVRGIFKLTKGDVITVSNIGAATLTLGQPTPTNSYNVSTIINRLS